MKKIMANFKQKYPNALIGNVSGNLQKIKQIDEFLEKYSFLKIDKEFVEFMKTYSGLSSYDEETEKDITLFGFDDNATISIEGNEFDEPILNSENYFLIGHIIEPEKDQICSFYYNINKRGIFERIDQISTGNTGSYNKIAESYYSLIFELINK